MILNFFRDGDCQARLSHTAGPQQGDEPLMWIPQELADLGDCLFTAKQRRKRRREPRLLRSQHRVEPAWRWQRFQVNEMVGTLHVEACCWMPVSLRPMVKYLA